MSKPITFGFGKPKGGAPSKPSIGLPGPKSKPTNGSKSTLRDDSDNEDEEEPRHETVTGFSSSGAILSRPAQKKVERVIKNAGNGDWRRRGKNLLPEEVQFMQNGHAVMVERDEVSKASGLQFAAEQVENGDNAPVPAASGSHALEEKPREMTEDEVAMQALLDSDKPRTNAVIKQMGNTRLAAHDETADFRSDVATRPDSSTLEDYAAMPVEEFGIAMLRGMGQKRRANGEVIDLNDEKKEENPRKARKQEGFLGIGAKAAPGADVELGAWGKADMRKNNKGEGFFTPLMRENKDTGERITEEEFQQRLRDSKGKGKGEEDWRERRDRNLERSGREKDHSRKNGDQKMLSNGDDYREQMNEFSINNSSSRRDRDDKEYETSRSRRDRDDRDYESSRSRRDRSRSRDRRRHRDDDDYDSRPRDKYKDKYRDDDRYDSSSSHRSRHRDRDRGDDRGPREKR